MAPVSEDLIALLRLAGEGVSGGRLLDVGCATGTFLLAASRAFEVEGVEISAATAAIAKRRGLNVTVGVLGDTPSERPFDVMTMLQVVEHLQDPKRVLKQAWERLRPGGLIYLNTPAIDSYSFDYLGASHVHVSSFGHVSLFSKRSLRALAESVGFEIVGHEECGGIDVSLHDVVSRTVAPRSFRHRMALYSPRLYYACELERCLSFGGIDWILARRGAQSYQRLLARRP